MKQSYFASFIFPIIMVGFPSIQSMKIAGSAWSLETNLDRLVKDSADVEAFENVRKETAFLADKNLRTPQQAKILSEAYIVLDSIDAAESIIEKAVQEDMATEPILKQREWLKANKFENIPSTSNGFSAPANINRLKELKQYNLNTRAGVQ